MPGMHQAIIAAELPCAELLAALQVEALDREGPVDSLHGVDLVTPRGRRRLVAGELHGRSCVVDGPGLWGVSRPDALAAIAARSGALVVACGAETAAGVYAFFAARGPQVLRIHHHEGWSLARPFDWGEPLPTEAACGLHERQGEGLMAALAHFGFDYLQWLHEAAKTSWLRRPAAGHESATPPILQGPVAHALDQHRRAQALHWPGRGRAGSRTGGARGA